jgi:hypothetical protein
MVEHLCDVVPLLDVPVQHAADEIDALGADGEGHPEVAVHDLIDAVERVLLVDDGVQQDAQCPDILFLATVRLARQDFRSCVVCEEALVSASCHTEYGAKAYQSCPQRRQMGHS